MFLFLSTPNALDFIILPHCPGLEHPVPC
jgi:hypothetical protein